MDPAALGTTLIGLEAIRRREADEAPPRPGRMRPRAPTASRDASASRSPGTLRTLADALEPRPRGAAHRA